MLIIQKKGTNQREKQHFKLKFIFLAVYAILFSFFVHILFFWLFYILINHLFPSLRNNYFLLFLHSINIRISLAKELL